MTRETKLGLVIGGAFIFCFALILSRTENEASVNQQIAGLWSSSLDEEDITEQAGNGDLSQSLIAYAPPRVEPQPHNRTRSPQSGAGPAQAATHGPSAPAEVNTALLREETPQPDPALDAELRQSPPTTTSPPPFTVTDAITNRPLPGPNEPDREVSHSDLVPTKQDAGVAEPAASAAVQRATPPPAPPKKRTPRPKPRRVQIYVVAKNDNLTKIARKFSGRRSSGKTIAQYVDLIFETNRDVLKDKNSVRAGQKLRIPIEKAPPSRALEETALAVAEAGRREKAAGARRTQKETTGIAFRWYQVKPKDRYTKIAKEQLGNEKRWKEIYELNKNIFADPDRIRPGVRIKLPK
ncbi:MAG: LysM peptidoglycan-binding domain-containing protein [Planctomycetes bacterium]|nr:LysM peptidoglycan-binding domain-containing protein [Planctomycetota bacterium]